MFSLQIQMPIYHLTKSEETPLNVAHYEVSSMRNLSTKVFVTNSPIYNVHYEICPPSDRIEVSFIKVASQLSLQKYTNPRLQNTSDLVLKTSQQFSSEAMQVSWKTVKLATAYGLHCAIQRTIVTEPIRNIKKIKAHKQQAKSAKSADCIPKSRVFVSYFFPDLIISHFQTIQMVKAPEKQLLKLCSLNDADREPRKVTEIIIGEQ